ncbi:hypothetical protein TRFO_33097 [Tritrichomonas foetus]|uniref:Uncharacterized protein n=1 Tax=Tritrichomonas foetus TaxID=1144522 RepID=A0A1J4JNH9_9EUKA|nr:hypothetical protein TRFO_33097 [Tritrichomonas foetus]|eukprot:OHT00266.1 hypothetical protein TRFO_33097 [Tritrichomonas foetus]
MNDTYLICDNVGENGYSIFPNAYEASSTPIQIEGFATYILSHHLDCPSYPFYSVLYENPSKSSYVIPIKFHESIPNFNILGFLTTPTEKGIVIHVSTSFFNTLDLRYSCIRVKGGNFFEQKNFYHELGALHHLGILHDYSPLDFYDKDNINNLINKLHKVYGTYGTLEDALSTTFQRIYFAIHFFNIQEAITVCNRYDLKENPSFGALFPSLQNSTELDLIKKFVTVGNNNDSPFIILINYLRTIFMAIHHQDPAIKDIDDEEGMKRYVHQLQEHFGFQQGNCDIKTATKIIESVQMTKFDPLPIFRMAGIDISLYTESDFPCLSLLETQKSDDFGSQIKTEMNHVIASTPDPRAKIDWMKDKINNELERYSERCNELSENISNIEERIRKLSERLVQVMEESEQAAVGAEAATKALNVVFESHKKIQIKFDKFQNHLSGEQRNTRVILVLGLFFTLVGVVRFFFDRH